MNNSGFRGRFFKQNGKYLPNILILLLECGSETEAKQLLAQLPTAKSGFYEYEIIDLTPFKALSEIFAKHNLPAPTWLTF